MDNRRALTGAALLALLAAATQWLLWLQRAEDAGDPFAGPPRSDYVARDYALTVRDAAGDFNFRLTGPRATRHPFLGSFDLEEPRMKFRDDDGHIWNARAKTGWVNKEGTLVKLNGDVVVQREAAPGVDPVKIESQALVAHPRNDLLESPVGVVVTEPGATLAGTGMTATLKERHLVLASDVSAHYDKKLRTQK